MRYLSLIAILLAGCSTPRLNIERLSKQLSEGNAAWSIKVSHREIEINRANPILGFHATAGNVSAGSPTNLSATVSYQVHTSDQQSKTNKP